MNTDQINTILRANRRTSQLFKECLPSDQLPPIHTYALPAAFVVNLDPITKRGSHWIAVYLPSNKEAVFFDSLGLNPTPNISNYISQFPKTFVNKQSYQSPLANTCGPHTICFIYYMSLGYTPHQYTRKLDRISDPDLFVYKMMNKIRNAYFDKTLLSMKIRKF